MGNIIKGVERREEIKKSFETIPNDLSPENRKLEMIKHIIKHYIKDETGFQTSFELASLVEIYMDIKFLAFPELTNFDKPIVLRKPSGNEQLNQ
jgi:hypothetical protein